MKTRFWNKVNKLTLNNCWEWTASTNGRGYGRFRINGKNYQAHRLSYEWANGKSPGEFYVCHICDNKSCVNPDHLFLGTQKQNMTDMISKGRDLNTNAGINRHKNYCIHGHEYTDKNTYTHYNKDGYVKRQCLTCKAIRESKK